MFEQTDEISRTLKTRAESIQPPAQLKRKVLEELELLNKNGQFLAKWTIDTLEEENPLNHIIRQLKPGMGKAILLTDQHSDPILTNQTNYEHEKWNKSLDELTHHFLPYSLVLPTNADLLEVYVMYGFDSLDEATIQEMHEEAARTNKAAVVRDLKKNDTCVGVKMVYRKEHLDFELHALTTTKNRIHVPDIDQHIIERISINWKEAVYLSDSIQSQLFWVTEDGALNVQYEIRASHASKDSIFKIAQSLI